MRTIMLLLSLAEHAEAAAGLSHGQRSYLLWVLRPAYAAAWDYAFGTHGEDVTHDFDLSAACFGGNTPGDALGLAASFREIAAALQQVMIQYTLLGLSDADSEDTDKSGIIRALACAGAWLRLPIIAVIAPPAAWPTPALSAPRLDSS